MQIYARICSCHIPLSSGYGKMPLTVKCYSLLCGNVLVLKGGQRLNPNSLAFVTVIGQSNEGMRSTVDIISLMVSHGSMSMCPFVERPTRLHSEQGVYFALYFIMATFISCTLLIFLRELLYAFNYFIIWPRYYLYISSEGEYYFGFDKF